MTNRVTLSALVGMTDDQKGAIPPDQLVELYADLADAKAMLEAQSESLHRAMSVRYADTFDGERSKDTGLIHIEDGRYRISQEIKKNVRYDQKKIKTILAGLEAKGEDISEYVEVSFKVPERKHAVWPQALRKVFEPARIVHLPRPSYSIEVSA